MDQRRLEAPFWSALLILEQALLRPRRRSLAEVLASMPDAGKDSDFERRQDDRRR
jgi:hypothetical protein